MIDPSFLSLAFSSKTSDDHVKILAPQLYITGAICLAVKGVPDAQMSLRKNTRVFREICRPFPSFSNYKYILSSIPSAS